MSWKRILKRVDIDLDEADKACCENARQEYLELFDDIFNPNEEMTLEIEQMDCSEFYELMIDEKEDLERMKTMSPEKLLEYTAKGTGSSNFWEASYDYADMLAFVTDYLSRLSDIIDELDKCKGEAIKVKDDLKVKPEGFNPEEPYGKHHPYSSVWGN